jgi:hypothetical protein
MATYVNQNMLFKSDALRVILSVFGSESERQLESDRHLPAIPLCR